MSDDKRNRLNIVFDNLYKKKEKALICYIVGGYPDIDTSREIIKTLIDAGADVIEIGIPFSDPMADGPTIQNASMMALSNGVTPSKCFDIVKEIRKTYKNTPFLFMTYFNIVFSNNLKNFLKSAKRSDIDGFIIPDLIVEEADEYLMLTKQLDLATIFLSAPNTSKKRLIEIASSSTGFVYMVSIFGTTGSREKFEKYTFETVSKAKELISSHNVPLVVGFGISNSKDAKNILRSGADGVIIGSSIIKIIMENESNKDQMLLKLNTFIRDLKSVCK